MLAARATAASAIVFATLYISGVINAPPQAAIAQAPTPATPDPISTPASVIPRAVLSTADLTVAPGEAMFFDASGSTVSQTASIEWIWPDKSFRVIDKNDLSAMAKAPKEPGLFTVMLSIHDIRVDKNLSGGETYRPVGSSAFVTVMVGTAVQEPPVAKPTPTTPTKPPAPDASTSPIKTAGFRAVFIYKAEEGIPTKLATPEFVKYMNDHAAKAPNGHPEWRRFDDQQTADTISDFPTIEEYLKLVPAGSNNYMVCGNGKTFYAGPIKDDFMVELKKHGG